MRHLVTHVDCDLHPLIRTTDISTIDISLGAFAKKFDIKCNITADSGIYEQNHVLALSRRHLYMTGQLSRCNYNNLCHMA
jgi:hypothetical protein